MNKLENEATMIGKSRGWDHANYTAAYGGDPHAAPEVPARYAPVRTYFTAAYAEGVQQFLDDDHDD
jgi:hypothetical protein